MMSAHLLNGAVPSWPPPSPPPPGYPEMHRSACLIDWLSVEPSSVDLQLIVTLPVVRFLVLQLLLVDDDEDAPSFDNKLRSQLRAEAQPADRIIVYYY